MATKEDKKPLIVPEAGNAAATEPKDVQDYAKPDNQVGAGWAGNQSATVSPSTGTTQNDGTKTLSYDQVKEFEKTGTVSGRDPNNPNVGPGGVNMKMGLLPSGTNFGVLAGAPSNVVIQHMLDAERKPRTPEEQERLEKKRKRDALFAAIGDGISALSNLYFTTKGSPSADQSKSISKAVRERNEKEDKEYETAMDRRIRLLKEQRAEYYRNEELKIKQGLAEAEKAAKEAKTANDVKKAEDLMKYYTERNQILKEEKKAEEKRKDEEAKQKQKESDNRIANNNKRTSAYQARVSNQNKNNDKNTAANVANKHDMIKKRKSSGGGGGSSKYTGPTYSANYDAKTGELKGYTVRGRGTEPPKKTGGKSAKSRFSIHK